MADVSAVAQTTATTATQDSATQLSGDFDTFLSLLTTQLQNQDPLSPMDSAEFTNQLVMFSSVEQQISQNTKLDELIGLQQGDVLTTALGYVGKDIEYEGNDFTYQGGDIDLTYKLDDTAKSTKVSILDEQNNVIYSFDGEISAGSHKFTWNGLDDAGNAAATDKAYHLEIGAVDYSDSKVETTSYVPTRVRGVETEDGIAQVITDHGTLPITSIISVREPTSASTQQEDT